MWTALVTLPLTIAVQEVCDRTALTTGRNIGELTTRRFGRAARVVVGILIVALICANALNIAADLLAVGAGMSLLHAGPTALWAFVAGILVTVLVVTGSFKTVGMVFKFLAAALLAYIVVLFIVDVDWASVAYHVLVPHITWESDYIALLVAVLGTTLSPYLLFWQSVHRIEEMREEPVGGSKPVPLRRRSRPAAQVKERESRFDVVSGFAFSNLVMFAIIVAAASTLGREKPTEIGSAAEAAKALEPIGGQFASLLFALGFIGSGMLAVPVLAGAGAGGLSGLLGKSSGYSRSFSAAPAFYGLVLVGTLGGTALSLLEVDPIRLLVFSAVINGIAAAPFMAVVMLIGGTRAIMGDNTNGRLSTILGWTAVALMTVGAILLFTIGGGGGLY